MSEELKTLKDFRPCGTCLTEHSCDCNDWIRGIHQIDCPIRHYCIFDELRQEAIKWIKSVPQKDNFYDLTKIEFETGLAIQWIKHFFNISEEDLK